MARTVALFQINHDEIKRNGKSSLPLKRGYKEFFKVADIVLLRFLEQIRSKGPIQRRLYKIDMV
jgi:hypothetical protein